MLAGLFAPIVEKGTEITTDEPTISSYNLYSADNESAERSITIYQCRSDIPPEFVDHHGAFVSQEGRLLSLSKLTEGAPADVQPLCEITANFLPKPVVAAGRRNTVYGVRKFEFDVQLFFGRSTITALIVENGEVRDPKDLELRARGLTCKSHS